MSKTELSFQNFVDNHYLHRDVFCCLLYHRPLAQVGGVSGFHVSPIDVSSSVENPLPSSFNLRKWQSPEEKIQQVYQRI